MVIEKVYDKSNTNNPTTNATVVNTNVITTNTNILTINEYMSLSIEEKLNYKGSIEVRCKNCKQTYIDSTRRSIINFDLSVCPYCKEYNYFNNDDKKKRIWERSNTSSVDILRFLNRKDMPSNVECEITIRFNNLILLKNFLERNNIKDMDVRLIF